MRAVWVAILALLFGCYGAHYPRRSGECVRVRSYAIDSSDVDRSAVRDALDEWTTATGYRECFVWRAWRPDIRVVVAHNEAEFGFYDPGHAYSQIAGAWVAKAHYLVLVPAHYTTPELRTVLVHEIGHALGLQHSAIPGSAMRPSIYDSPAHGPISIVDVESYCRVNGCD